MFGLPGDFTTPPVLGEPAATGAGHRSRTATAPAPTTPASRRCSTARARQTGDAGHQPHRAEPSLEEYWPDIAELDHQETVTDEAMPASTFFDLATVHVLTTATLNRLHQLHPPGRFEVRRFRPNIVVGPDDDDADFVERELGGAQTFGSARTSCSRSPTTARVAS